VLAFLKSYLSYGLIAGYLLCDWSNIVDRVHSISWNFSLVLFFGLYAITAASLFLTASIRRHGLRIAFALAFCAASLVLQTFERGTHQPLSYSAFVSLLDARGDTGDALRQYGNVLRTTVPLALLLLVALCLPARRLPVPKRVPELAPVATIGMLCAMLFVRGGEGARALPAPYAPIAYSFLGTGSSLAMAAHGKITVRRNPGRVERDIVLIVDESVSPLYLDVDNPAGGVRSGLATPRPGLDVVNFGYAAAILNCSAGANATLRFGGTRENYRAMRAGGVGLWDYARRAGLRTVYLDGQRNHGVLQNLMTSSERAKIDEFVQLDGVPILYRDVTLAKILADHINNGRPEFIYVNKVGGHFPVQDRFPDEMTVYRPILARGMYANHSDTGTMTGFKGFDGSLAAWKLYRNSYRNTLLWNVGEFFDRLFARADMTRATVIYTSDHGQDLHERGAPGYGTHCGSLPEQEEGIVPLLIIESKQAPTFDWRGQLAANRNRTSGYHIFPTLLALMGYHAGDIEKHYGAPLHKATHDPFTFNKDYHVVLGRDPVWERIDLARLATAPVSDFTPAMLAKTGDRGLPLPLIEGR
jgi:glucan phosphoethanolaminetransferase (alkaline phosphatase superfamily)